MQTPEVLLAVVDRLRLTENKDYARGYRGDSGTLREWVAKKLSKNLAIYQGQLGSQLIYVTYSANKPAEAAQVANTVAEVYLTSSLIRSLKSQLTGQQARHGQAQCHPGTSTPGRRGVAIANRCHPPFDGSPINNPSVGTSAEKSPAIQQEALPVEYVNTNSPRRPLHQRQFRQPRHAAGKSQSSPRY